MQISSRMMKILERRKNLLQNLCECKNGCEKCNKEFQTLVKYAEASIPLKFWDLHLKDYEKNDRSKEKIIQYIKNIDSNYNEGIGLYLQGSTGLGKTFLACIVLKAALKKGYSARFTTMTEAITLLSDTFYDKTERELFQQAILEVDFLVVDEIEKVHKSEKSTFVETAMDMLFRKRANELLPVIVTSNKSRDELAEELDSLYGASLISLFNEHLVTINFTGIDHRVSINKEIKEKAFGLDE